VQQLLGVYQGYFDRQAAAGGAAQNDEQTDNVRQGIVVFLGALVGECFENNVSNGDRCMTNV
jgi:hypothetical protein